ncbi:MAG: thioredoxin family protein [Dysgonamonadaceae bacterium]|jgi:peroxiredoxin|nr:thioredoxin family protein [Dysgonamonadaceae bacterium]
MYKNKLILAILSAFCGVSQAQTVKLDFPASAGKEVNLYTFRGDRADTLSVEADAAGKAVFSLPTKDYRGIIVLGNKDLGLVELVLAEPLLEVECRDATLTIQTAVCKNSAENDYLRKIFSEQSRRFQQFNWLQQGEAFYDFLDTPLVENLKKQAAETQAAIESAKRENRNSPLFSARYYEASEFMSRLYQAEQLGNQQVTLAVAEEMETAAPIPVIYRSGNNWLAMHNEYINAFNRAEGLQNKHLQYAKSVLKTLARLQPPYYEAYLAGSVTEMERFGWMDSRDTVLARVLAEKPNLKSDNRLLQTALNAFRSNKMNIAPEIEGLQKSAEKYEQTLAAFYDSDCNTCVNEMRQLANNYSVLKARKIRVISIAADKDEKHFTDGSKDFPWADKLCDYKGFEGANFVGFNIIATPTLVLIDKDGKIVGRYSGLAEYLQQHAP